ncbi:MAG: NAD kinase [bacterium]|nr:NAD kinase [Candidatus Limimorpha caballi]
MMKIALYGKTLRAESEGLLKEVIGVLHGAGAEISVYGPFLDTMVQCLDGNVKYHIFNGYEQLKGNADMVFSLGGDGTVLDCVPLVRDSGIPVFGINLGRLGFLSSVSSDETLDAVSNILAGNYGVEHRTMVEIIDNEALFDGINYGLNEVSIQHRSYDSLIEVQVFIGDRLLNKYWGDGVLLSTPTGSTAYSLSAGGPIVAPDVTSFVITPIAAHNLSMRPVIISDDSRVKIKVNGRCEKYALGLDSRIRLVDRTFEFEIKKADFFFNIVKMPYRDFFGTVRSKLLWGNDVRN